MRFYETTLVINPRISDGDREKIVARITEAMKAAGGEIVETVNQGVQRLSYPLRKHNEANYTVIRVNVAPAAVAGIRRQITLIEDVYLAMVVLVSPEKGTATKQAEPAAPAAEVPVEETTAAEAPAEA